MRCVIGIDEAGRGPLAGPVSVAAVVVENNFNKKFFKGVKDSKMLSEEDRELWFDLIEEARNKGELDFAVSLVSETVIDKHGINYAVSLGIKRCLKKLSVDPNESQVFLDGGIRAPKEFVHQLTVIKGDEKIPLISLASIVAKVVRDRRMKSLSLKYPAYHLEINKGYGTFIHREVIRRLGPTPIHRKSFIKNIVK